MLLVAVLSTVLFLSPGVCGLSGIIWTVQCLLHGLSNGKLCNKRCRVAPAVFGVFAIILIASFIIAMHATVMDAPPEKRGRALKKWFLDDYQEIASRAITWRDMIRKMRHAERFKTQDDPQNQK